MALSVDSANTNQNQIKVMWSAVSGIDNGGSDVLSYNLQWDAGIEGQFVELVGQSNTYLSLFYTVTSAVDGLTPGLAYTFRYRAKNIYGWGPFSNEATFLAAAIPLTADPVRTTIENLYIKISWNQPDD